ncbi:Mannosylfructose-phosphate synthase [subsurface metagenome]
MKRILMVSTHGYFEGNPSFGRADTGGQIVFVIELSKALVLAKLGYKVDILTRQFEDLDQIEPLNEEVGIIRIPCGGRDFIPKEYLVEYLPELVDGFIIYCRKNRLSYDFIDSHYWDAGFVGMKLTDTFNIPHIFTPHSLGIWKETRMRQAAAEEGTEINELDFERELNFKHRNATEKAIMESANQTIATTPEQKEIMCHKYGISAGKVAIITPGFFPEKYRRIDKSCLSEVIRQYKLPERFVFTVGRITPYKGYDLLIKAFQQVAKELPEVKLVLAIGSHEPTEVAKRNELSQLAEGLGLANNTLFYGHVRELEAFYNLAEILVMPSTYEPFGMVAIESMACGTPAEVTDRGGLRNFLVDGQDALIVDPLDTQALTGAILKLLKDKRLRKEISQKGYEKAHSMFTWEHIAENTLRVIS